MTSRHLTRSISASALFVMAVAALVVTPGLDAASPASAASIEGDVTWGVRTASNDNGTDRDNFEYTLDPGSSVSDALIVTNHDSEPLELSVYSADGFTTSSGQLDLVTAGTPSVAVGAWSTVAENTLQVAPGSSIEVPFTVTIPDNATPGDYAGGILTALSQPALEDGITVDRRLGIRIHLRVLGDLAPALSVDDMHVEYSGTANPFGTGDATVSYTLRNTGNTRLTAEQSVTLAGLWGMFPITIAGVDDAPELLPNETWTVSVPAEGILPTFWLTATSAVTPVVPTVAGDSPAIEPVQTAVGTWAVPWSALALLISVAGAIVVAALLIRRRRAQHKVAEDARVHAAVAEALRHRPE